MTEDELKAVAAFTVFLENYAAKDSYPTVLLAEQLRLSYHAFSRLVGLEAMANCERDHNLDTMCDYHGVCRQCKTEDKLDGQDFCEKCYKDYLNFVKEAGG